MTTAIVVAAWLLCGCAVGMWMVRRGHSPYLWLVLVSLGPLALLFALTAKDEEGAAVPHLTAAGGTRPAPIHVLAGIDGSPASIDAITTAVRLFGSTVGRVTLVAVLDFEASEAHPLEDVTLEADAWLVEAAHAVVRSGGPEPDRVVLVGEPAHELTEWAETHDVDTIVVASSSHWVTRHLLAGRVAHRLLDEATAPVVVMPASLSRSRPE